MKNIATVTATSAGSLVKPGTTVDVYAVNQATATQLQIAGGGNNINSAYSAIYSMPGVNGLPGNYGFGQVFYIHGSSYNQIGYEFDGIPVNRAFDNYNANSLSNLGATSTEVYTGGGPAAGTSATLGGYINQVIKTGTYPGYIDLGGWSRHAGVLPPSASRSGRRNAGPQLLVLRRHPRGQPNPQSARFAERKRPESGRQQSVRHSRHQLEHADGAVHAVRFQRISRSVVRL